ncbi:antibiotic biosynthesis monooxygenase [Actinomadura sp. CNU-125]|uniref:antibiotic biosynthesis monooxygenase family protein n=1 Tax=Actinomadura sp. CNU-125 TaxID=1904961 RepID=UPI000960B0FB|nr:antibiotic biosynthesis monooxygenase family protein [Actinomadura sp. CNU-125]OLT25798.1 antibiotic biosynthesis monooxygenase [Actinomadura sp. CNU-125]
MAATADTTHVTAFRVMLRMDIRPGMEREFEETWHRVGTAIVGHPANLGHWLSRSADEDGVYFVVSDWTDEERFREFEHSDAHVEHRQKLHPYRSGGSMTTMNVVYAMTGAAVRDA